MEPDFEYERVNEVVNNVFFDGRWESSPVYLDLEDEPHQEMARELGCEEEQLEQILGACVSKTLTFDKSDIYSWHRANLVAWIDEQEREAPPPFSALLLAFSLAAEHMRLDGNYSASNYYQRLFRSCWCTQ